MPTFQQGELLPEHEILQHKIPAATEEANQCSDPEEKQAEHDMGLYQINDWKYCCKLGGQSFGEGQATFWWLVGGVILGTVIPFTLIAILPTIKQLLIPTPDGPPAKTERLLARWGTLHRVRSALSGLALLLFLYLLIFTKSQ